MARFLKKRKDVSGAVPGSLIFLGKKKMDTSRIRVFQYNTQIQKETELSKFKDLAQLPTDNLVTWINIYGLHDTELIQSIGEQFRISNLALEDIVNTDHRPRIIEDENHIIVIIKAITYNASDDKIHTDQISFVLGHNYLITFQEKVGDYFTPIRERIRNKKGRVGGAKSDYLMYTMIDSLIDNSLEIIELIGEKIEMQDKKLITAHQDLAQTLYNYKNEVSYLRKNIRPLKEIVFHLEKSESHLLKKDTKPYIEDVRELIHQSLDAVEIYYTMINDQLNLYNTHVNNKANEVMKFLTMFASIFIPLTFVVGIYGTNFDYLPELRYKYSYFIMWGVMIIMVGGMLLYFKKKKWL